MEAIALGKKFYVLWNIEDKVETFHNGAFSIEFTHYTYIKIISKDKDKDFTKYPNAIEMENLNGHTKSFSVKKGEKVWIANNVFRFGKYYLQKIDNCTDYEYMKWYYEKVYGTHKKYVENILLANGYIKKSKDVKFGGLKTIKRNYITSKKEESLNNWMEAQIKNGMPFDITPEKNLNENGCFKINKYIFKFQDVKLYYYEGITYSLPISNGKPKRIKNKTITIHRYSIEKVDNKTIINIKDFDIVKK